MNLAPWSPIANHLWQSTLFAVAAGLITLTLRSNSARVRHCVWLIASLKFLIPASLLVTLGGEIRWKAPSEPLSRQLLVVLDQASQPFAIRPATSPLPATPSGANRLPKVIGMVWAAGFLGIACSWWLRWQLIRSTVCAGSLLRPIAPIPARSSPAFLEPAVFGVFRPVLLLPDGIFERLTPEQLHAVVAHELCHVRHRDNLVASIHMFVETVFWFHPLVWWIGKRMVQERECACDEEVLRLGYESKIYAEGILNVCRLYLESPLECVSGVTGSSLNDRIRAIVANRTVYQLSSGKKVVLATVGTAVVMLPVSIGMMGAAPSEAQFLDTATPRFEVASVKPCKDQDGRMRGSGESVPGTLNTGCDLLVDDKNLGFIQRAYVRFAGGHVNPFGVMAIRGGPKWIRSQMYQINAKVEGHPSREMMQGPMLQVLLEERFKLKIRRETQEGPVYELALAKASPKLQPFQEGSCTQMPMTFPLPSLAEGQRYCKAIVSLRGPGIHAEGATLSVFSKLLNLVLDRPVIDRTGILGRFEIHVEFSASEATPNLRGSIENSPVPAPDPADPTIFTALQEQLGLKLVAAKGPVEFLAIDHIERPSAN